MRVLVATDKFKGTLSAEQAGRAIAAGWRRSFPEADLRVVPMADGGEGTLDALVSGLGGERRRAKVSGPLGDPVLAEFGMAGELGIVEMARASGLGLLAPTRRDPKRTSTRGTGDLILSACLAGSRRVLICIGGSATNDGGAGMAQAVGIRLLDFEGHDLAPGGAALLQLARIDMTSLDGSVKSASLVVASDVDNPLVGPSGASAVYGPQKGASEEDVVILDRALRHFAAVVHRDLGLDLRDVPGAGAAGGLGAGLIAFLGARLRPGVEVVIEALDLRNEIARSDLVVTGEGRFDEQSLRGKVAHGVLNAAREAGVEAIVLCGERRIEQPGIRAFSMAERFGLEPALERPAQLLEELAADVAKDVVGDQPE